MPVQTRLRGGWEAFVATYTAMFLAGLVAFPFVVARIVDRHAFSDPPTLAACFVISTAIVAVLLWARIRCGSKQLSLWRGLSVITGALMVGHSWLSFVTVFPGLLIATVLTACISIFSSKTRAENRFTALVRWCWEHRLRRS